MAFIRDIKRKSSRALHNKMLVAANYYSNASASPVLVHVRVHSSPMRQGNQNGAGNGFGEIHELKPAVVFDRNQVAKPPRNSFVIITADEGYIVDTLLPVDGEFITAEVATMSAADLIGKQVP